MRIKAITSLCPMTPEQTSEIIRLRALKLSPKQIAHKLGLRPAEVSTWLKNQAEEVALSRREGASHFGKNRKTYSRVALANKYAP